LVGLSWDETVHPSEPTAERSGRPARADGSSHPARGEGLWEQVFSETNVMRALQRVERNGGAPGVDGLTTAQLRPWLVDHWPKVRRALDEGSFRPAPVRRVSIPKPDGGVRMLGVPTVLDRLIQQAMLQVLTPIFDPAFSESSFGFRPGRSAHQAVRTAQGFVQDGFRWVVDVDLDRFFDRVQHDALMARVARRVVDRKLLRLIRRYLDAGIMVDGVKQPSAEGTPQGSPLSPLLANVMLDDLDRELEARGHRFVRYADDLRVFVRSPRAAARVLDGVTAFVEGRLKLKVNRDKSRVSRAALSALLGFGFLVSRGRVRVRVHPKARQRLRERVRRLTSRTWSVSMATRIGALNRFIAGWCAYFALADTPSVFDELDEWLRRRLRQVRWKEWKRYATRRRKLVALGIPEDQAGRWAASSKGSWRIAGSAPLQRALPNRYWSGLGLHGFRQSWHRLRTT
jgi:group II intron reverse transcriptase/maturase